MVFYWSMQYYRLSSISCLRSFIVFFFISVTDSKWVSLSADLSFKKRTKFHETRSGEYNGHSDTVTYLSAKIYFSEGDEKAGALSWSRMKSLLQNCGLFLLTLSQNLFIGVLVHCSSIWNPHFCNMVWSKDAQLHYFIVIPHMLTLLLHNYLKM